MASPAEQLQEMAAELEAAKFPSGLALIAADQWVNDLEALAEALDRAPEPPVAAQSICGRKRGLSAPCDRPPGHTGLCAWEGQRAKRLLREYEAEAHEARALRAKASRLEEELRVARLAVRSAVLEAEAMHRPRRVPDRG